MKWRFVRLCKLSLLGFVGCHYFFSSFSLEIGGFIFQWALSYPEWGWYFQLPLKLCVALWPTVCLWDACRHGVWTFRSFHKKRECFLLPLLFPSSCWLEYICDGWRLSSCLELSWSWNHVLSMESSKIVEAWVLGNGGSALSVLDCLIRTSFLWEVITCSSLLCSTYLYVGISTSHSWM